MKYPALIALMAIATHTASAALKADPALETEKLPNSMTLAAYKNSEPPGRMSMRLLVKRGSACETESERGLAHFIEHMAFNGTKNFPSGDMVEYFQRLGMAFGADTNAHTSFTETVYKLDMPDCSDRLADDGLKLLRDYADGVLFTDEAVEKERGVVLAEKNSRDDPEYRRAVAEWEHLFKGTAFAERMPIGEESVLRAAKRAELLRYYRQNYRPENMALVMVGDFDRAKMLAKAREYFSDMKPFPGEAARAENFGKIETGGYEFDFSKADFPVDAAFHEGRNLPNSGACVAAVAPRGADSPERRAVSCRLAVLAGAISSRFLRTANEPESKISRGWASNFDFDKFAECFYISADAPVGGHADALYEVFKQIYSAQNISNEEIEAAKKKLLDLLESRVKSAPTRKNRELAGEICSAFSEDMVYTSPATDLETARKALESFGAKDAVDLLKRTFGGAKMKIFLSDAKARPSPVELEKLAVSAVENAAKNPYGAEKFQPGSLEFSKFAAPSPVEERRYLADLGITQVAFGNGVRLNLKRTDFSKDEVLMKVAFGNGVLDIPLDKPEYYAGLDALMCSGTKFQSQGEVGAALYRLKIGLGAGVDGNSFFVSGRSSSKDFEQMVLFCATLAGDAGFRSDALGALKKRAQAFYRDFETDPMARIRFLTFDMVKSPKLAKVPGTFAAFEKIEMSELEKWLAPILKNSYMEISVVGDFDVDAAVEIFGRSFGALPGRARKKDAPYAKVETVDAPAEFLYKCAPGDEPRSAAACLWRSRGRENSREMRAANVLGAVLDDILRREVREKDARTYSPFAYNNSSEWMENTGFVCAATFVEPRYNAEILDALEKCAETAKNNISEDEFERAKIPLVKGVQADMRKNSYWLEAFVNLSQAKPLNLELARTVADAYKKVELEEVRRLASEIFSRGAVRARVVPADNLK